jgi:hypothetical protein
VKIVRGTDADIINLGTEPFKFVEMPVKPFKLNKKVTLGKIPVKQTDTVKLVEARQKIVACILDCFQVTYGNIPCYAYQTEIFWG